MNFTQTSNGQKGRRFQGCCVSVAKTRTFGLARNQNLIIQAISVERIAPVNSVVMSTGTLLCEEMTTELSATGMFMFNSMLPVSEGLMAKGRRNRKSWAVCGNV